MPTYLTTELRSDAIADNELNQDFSIDLVGRNYENYGEIFAKTFVDLLDNFATDATPIQ